MTSVNKKVLLNTQTCANSSFSRSVVISDIRIHQDNVGRFSLNDLHKASGSEQRHQPRYWLALQQTDELIGEIINSGITLIPPFDKKRGCKGGTYVCKELVYSYAMWISAAFALKVIRAYDALISGNAAEAEVIAKTTVDERTPLRSLVNRIMAKYGTTYQTVYKLVHREFGVNHIEDLSPKQTFEAMEYLATKAIEGEFIGKNTDLIHNTSKQLTTEELNALCWVWNAAECMRDKIEQVYPSLAALNSGYAGSFFSMAFEYKRTLEAGRKILERETADIVPNPNNISDESWRRVLPRLRQVNGL